MVKSVSSSEIYKNFGFLPKLRFLPLFLKLEFFGVSQSKMSQISESEIEDIMIEIQRMNVNETKDVNPIGRV